MPLVYAELRNMASHHLVGERGDHTLQSTALVHEAYLRGLTIEDTSEVLGVSPATVKRDWLVARAWLLRAMTGEA